MISTVSVETGDPLFCCLIVSTCCFVSCFGLHIYYNPSKEVFFYYRLNSGMLVSVSHAEMICTVSSPGDLPWISGLWYRN